MKIPTKTSKEIFKFKKTFTYNHSAALVNENNNNNKKILQADVIN